MGLFKKIFSNKEAFTTIQTEKGGVYAPLAGEVIPLDAIEDAVFSQGMVGQGCGIKPCANQVVAPFDGEIVSIAATKHAIGIRDHEGIEILIHIGMDTVKMQGQGFKSLVKTGDKVRCGQPLIKFSIDDIKASGYVTTTAVVITNSAEYEDISVSKIGEVAVSEKIMVVR